MKFGLRYCNTGPYIEATRAVELVQAAEEAGFESAWTVQHTVIPENHASLYPYSPDGRLAGNVFDFPRPDPLIWMAYVAARTETIKFGTGVLILPQLSPVVTAKQVATLDFMSGGRIVLGIGVGWLREEFEAIGASFEDRAARTDEYVGGDAIPLVRRAAVVPGRVHPASTAPIAGRSRLGGAVPIHIGGHSKAAARRAGRLGDGFFPARGRPGELVRLARETAESCGRDPGAIEISLSCPQNLEELKMIDADRVLIPVDDRPDMAAPARTPEEVLAWRSRIEDFTDV